MNDDGDPSAKTVEFYAGVLPEEMKAIRARRRGACPGKYEELEAPRIAEDLSDADFGARQKAEQCAEAHRVRPLGVAFSGGGIRSATFNLGVLQGLAERGLPRYIDYLSTVSGGGYIGSWFHGVVRSSGGQPKRAAACLSPDTHPVPGVPDDDPISFLRKYSNYLAPKPGVFSADTWVIGSIWLRNVLLNQLILLPAIAVAVLAGLMAGFLQQALAPGWWSHELSVVLAGALLLGIVFFMSRDLRSVAARSFDEVDAVPEPGSGASYPASIFVACAAITCAGGWETTTSKAVLALVLLILFVAFQQRGGFVKCFAKQHPGLENAEAFGWLQLLWMAPTAAASSWYLIGETWKWMAVHNAWMVLTFAPAFACLSLMAGVSLLVGLMGADYPDAAREWLASIGSNLAMICAGWIVFFFISGFGPWGVSWVLVNYGRVGWASVATWAGTTAAGVFAGHSSSTNGENKQGNPVLALLVKITPTLFVLGYLLLISFGVHALVRNVSYWKAEHAQGKPREGKQVQLTFSATPSRAGIEVKRSELPKPNWFESHLQDMADWCTYFEALVPNKMRWSVTLIVTVLGAIVTVIASLRVNINEFSVHHFYKNRLVRCYLGASNNRNRRPNARTGFDPKDDFPLAHLRPDAKEPYFGPFAIINTALNLNAGSELATQERKASSFVFTPLFSGYEPGYSKKDKKEDRKREPPDFHMDGFRNTAGYSAVSGPGIGTTMAISGAAANPNSGYHTSPPMAFLLTVFNVRLGWWLGNSRFGKSSPRSGPMFALKYLLLELGAQTTARTRFVNLSDGGHFDNLGIYELVRRRCRYIIACDAEEDPDLTFESLGGAIRKCRADFGVEIDINPDPIRLGAEKFSSAHCVMGSITYPEMEGGCAADLCEGGFRDAVPGERAKGWLLYLKTSVTGNEPADIAQYRSAHKAFPHEPTVDEFYSESQFESYRRLGLHTVRETFADVDRGMNNAHCDLREMFQSLMRKWYAPISVTSDQGARLTDKYSALMKRLAESEQLRADFGPLLPGVPHTTASHATLSLESFEFGTELIQLMEDIVNEYEFEQSDNFSNPGIAGWARVFRRWVDNDRFFNDVWKRTQEDYQHGFQSFMNNLRDRAKRPPTPPTI